MKEDHTDEEFRAYIARVEAMAEAKKISRTKRDRLLCPKEEIPSDFLERDLRQSQYIARKAMEILHTVVRNVWATSGSVTDFFRHQWGYNRILHDLSLDKYALAGLVEEVEYEHKGQTHRRQQIKNWSKRFDHRHHAVDALVIALTRQGYVQRLNNLNAEHGNIHAELVKEMQISHATNRSLNSGLRRGHVSILKRCVRPWSGLRFRSSRVRNSLRQARGL